MPARAGSLGQALSTRSNRARRKTVIMAMDHEDQRYDPDSDVSRYLDLAEPDSLPLLLSLTRPSPLPRLPQSDHLYFTPSFLSPPPLPLQCGFEQEQFLMPPVIATSEHSHTGSGPASPGIQEILSYDDHEIAAIVQELEGISVEGGNGLLPLGANEEGVRDLEPIFVPFEPGQLDCSNCLVLRELLHSSGARNLFFVIHGGSGTFEHAIFDNEYTGEDGQPPSNELFYVDLRQRTHEWVKNFLYECITLLKDDTSGNLQDSRSSFCAAVCSGIDTSQGDPNMEIDLQTLEQLLAAPSPQSDPASSPLLQTPEVIGAYNTPPGEMIGSPSSQWNTSTQIGDVYPAILESSQAELQEPMVVEDLPAPVGGPSNDMIGASSQPQAVRARNASADRPSMIKRSALAIQRERISNMGLRELADYLHLPMSVAARRLNMCSTALKHICRRNGVSRWPSRQISAINRQILRLEDEAVRVKRRGGLLLIKEEIDKLKADRADIYIELLNSQGNKDQAD